MDIESLRSFCLLMPGVTEDVKWDNDLCFLVAGKMFCITALDPPHTVAFKVRDEEFDEMVSRPGIIPAPYLARYKWVLVEEPGRLKGWEGYVRQSYELVRAKLPKKVASAHGLL